MENIHWRGHCGPHGSTQHDRKLYLFDLPVKVESGDFARHLIDYFNEIMPNMIPLVLFGIMYLYFELFH
jgi:hypothetical protein